MIYGKKLRDIREEKDLKIYEISKMLGFDKDTYGKFEREYKTIPLKHLVTVCNFFNVSLDYIFNFTELKQYKNIKKEIDIKIAGNRLKQIRLNLKLKQENLAYILGTTQPMIVKYEKGKNLISTLFLYAICSKYKISADYLLGRIDTPLYWNNKK